MANTAQAKKRARQAEAHRTHNAAQRTQLTSAIKKVRVALATQDKIKAQTAYRAATAVIDRFMPSSRAAARSIARSQVPGSEWDGGVVVGRK